MVNAVHTVLFSKQPEELRAFFRDVLGFPAVDAGHGWLIFALPPGEMGVHPASSEAENGKHELYLMCDDIHATVQELKNKGVAFTQPVKDAGWGLLTSLRIPGGGELQLYQPRHASPRNVAQAG